MHIFGGSCNENCVSFTFNSMFVCCKHILRVLPVNFGDYDVSPVDEGDGLTLCESFCVRTLNKDLWPVPHWLHSHICILQKGCGSRNMSLTDCDSYYKYFLYHRQAL